MLNLPKSLHSKINLLSLILIAVTLPFHILLCSYSIALFVLNQLIEGNIREKFIRSISNKTVLLLLLFFLLHIAGLVNSQNIPNGMFELEKKVALLIFPLILFPVVLSGKDVAKTLAAFLCACLLLSFIFLAGSIHKYLQTHDLESFMLHNLSEATGMHRVYASMYFLFCIYILYYLRHHTFFSFRYSTPLYTILTFYFAILIFLMSSRMMVLLTVTSLAVILIHSAYTTRFKASSILMLVVFLALSCGILLANERIRTIMKETFTDLDKGNTETNFTGPNMRILIWKYSLEIAKDHPMGVGTGDAQDELYTKYVQNNFKWGILSRFNAHNQYLQTLLELGILGLLLLIASWAVPFFQAFRKKHFLYIGFMVLFSIACLSESMLASQKGIVFFAFFNTLLAFHYPEEKS